MDDAERSGVLDVVAARRFELVDPHGRPRAVLGDAEATTQEWLPALHLLDDAGRTRVSVALSALGPSVTFVADGNVVVALGVGDRHPEVVGPGPYLVLCGPDGAPAWEVRVDEDGRVHVAGQQPSQ